MALRQSAGEVRLCWMSRPGTGRVRRCLRRQHRLSDIDEIPCGERARPALGCEAAQKPAAAAYLTHRIRLTGAASQPSAGRARSPQQPYLLGFKMCRYSIQDQPCHLPPSTITLSGLVSSLSSLRTYWSYSLSKNFSSPNFANSAFTQSRSSILPFFTAGAIGASSPSFSSSTR